MKSVKKHIREKELEDRKRQQDEAQAEKLRLQAERKKREEEERLKRQPAPSAANQEAGSTASGQPVGERSRRSLRRARAKQRKQGEEAGRAGQPGDGARGVTKRSVAVAEPAISQEQGELLMRVMLSAVINAIKKRCPTLVLPSEEGLIEEAVASFNRSEEVRTFTATDDAITKS